VKAVAHLPHSQAISILHPLGWLLLGAAGDGVLPLVNWQAPLWLHPARSALSRLTPRELAAAGTDCMVLAAAAWQAAACSPDDVIQVDVAAGAQPGSTLLPRDQGTNLDGSMTQHNTGICKSFQEQRMRSSEKSGCRCTLFDDGRCSWRSGDDQVSRRSGSHRLAIGSQGYQHRAPSTCRCCWLKTRQDALHLLDLCLDFLFQLYSQQPARAGMVVLGQT